MLLQNDNAETKCLKLLFGRKTSILSLVMERVAENRKLDDEIKYFEETGSFDFLFLIKIIGVVVAKWWCWNKVFEAIIWKENGNAAFSDKGDVAENRKLDDDIKYFGKAGGLIFLLFIKNQSFTLQNV